MKKFFLFFLIPFALQANEIIPITKKDDFDWWTNRAKPTLLIVTSQWCMQCKQLKTWIGKQDFKGVTFLTIDSKVARRFRAGPVRSLPTIIGYKNGERIFAGPVLDVVMINESVKRLTE